MPIAGLLAALALAAAGPAGAQEAAPFELPAPTTAQHVTFSADHFDYDKSSDVVHLKGLALVKESTWTIHADEMWLDLDDRIARASGAFRMEDGSNVLFGDAGGFDFRRREGTAYGVSSGYAPWRIHGEEARIDSRRRYHYRHAWFTSCSLDPEPHYRFRAGSVLVRPRKYLFATNVVFFLGKTPLFYTPFLWKSLRKEHVLRTRVSPGYDRRNGVFARTTTLFSLTPALQGKLFLDYYGAQGFGSGAELQFRRDEEARGALYGYRIRERHSGQERWAVLGDHYQALASSVAVQARLQTQSDPDFNNHYTRANAFRVTQELVNGAALVRATALTTTRLSYSRLDVDDPARRRFIKTAESAPRLEWRTAPLSPKGSAVLHTFEVFADHSFALDSGFTRRSAGAAWSATRAFPLWRGASLTPRAGFGETYEDRRDVFTSFASTRSYVDAWSGRYQAGGDLRVSTPVGDWDAAHDLGWRMKPGTFERDAGALDHGVEKDLVSLTHALRPHPRVFTRVSAGYDFRVFRDHSAGFRQRVQPFTGDVTWSPLADLSLTARDDYQLQEGNRSFILQADYGDRAGRFIGLGAVQNLASAGHYFLSQEFGWGPSSGTWSLSGALRSDLRSTGGMRFETAQLFEKELTIRKDFHDFRTRTVFRIRPGGIKEAQIRVDLLLDKERASWDRQVYTDYTGR